MKTGVKPQRSCRAGLPQRACRAVAQQRRAFSLLEVMIAIMIFCMCTFAILCLVSSSLENTRRLQRPIVDAGMVASALSLTNKLVEGNDSGDLGDLLGDAYQGYKWTSAVQEVQSNKLFQVDLILQSPARGNPVVSKMSILLYRPQSDAGSLDGGMSTR
jgi:prepilin-type N-terminal cleavage/methylation domain-containing protein